MRGTRLVTSGLIAITLAAGPNPLPAGSVPPPGSGQEQEAKPGKADLLEARAMELLAGGEIEFWGKAAELLERSARLRPEASFSRAKSLKIAANLLCWSGSKAHARDLFQEAAEVASAAGELGFAANTFLDAAILSAELRMGRHTIEAARIAEQLAASPDLPTEERAAIRSRLERLGAPLRLAEIM